MITSIPPVVPAGRMARHPQPALVLPGGRELRPWRESDADVLVASCLDPAIAQWNRPEPLSRGAAREKIARWGHRWTEEAAAIWAISRRDDDRPVGLIGVGDLDLRGGSGELLYWLLPSGRGEGAALDATLRVSRWALDELGLHRLRITHSVRNPASCQVARRAGFTLEGTMRSALLHADGWHDEHLHARVAGDPWPRGN
ncbi:GNAT family N-acetyltransferase [Streptomyces sp. NBC_00083]|uniref:GNAT family N-acetyltransferase n=1 Tax=Streptomyces sp. NBC_00083 TaxID=2975647 RepID=UPI0022540F77|nr:GNAT family N-acetyltransferase [Streptomyces sp. NBC_00083]MCX5386776.1 GNAT family N-acetyltransferase [Streptomyces sp. NBC_00083]